MEAPKSVSAVDKIHLPGLNRLDQRELAEALPGSVEFERQGADGGRHGELLTATAIVVVSVEALRVLAGWLLRTRRTSKIKQTIIRERPDGSRETLCLQVDVNDSEAPDQAVVDALSKLLSVDTTLLGRGGGDG